MEFSIGKHLTPYLTAIQVPLEIFPWTPGVSRTLSWEPLM